MAYEIPLSVIALCMQMAGWLAGLTLLLCQGVFARRCETTVVAGIASLGLMTILGAVLQLSCAYSSGFTAGLLTIFVISRHVYLPLGELEAAT